MDIGTAFGALTTPDPTLTDDLNSAYVSLGKAAQSCSGVDSVTSPAMHEDLAEIQTGVDDLIKSQQRLAALGVKWKVGL